MVDQEIRVVQGVVPGRQRVRQRCADHLPGLLPELGDCRSAANGAIEEARELPEGGPVGKAMVQLAGFTSRKFQEQEWWPTLGRSGLDQLATVSCSVLSMIPAAAASCERNWSLLGSITGGKHARLSPERAAKLVYIRAHQHLLHR